MAELISFIWDPKSEKKMIHRLKTIGLRLSIIGYEFYNYKSSKNPYKTSMLVQGCQIKPKWGLRFEHAMNPFRIHYFFENQTDGLI